MSECRGCGRPEWKGIGLVYLDDMVIKGDERGREGGGVSESL